MLIDNTVLLLLLENFPIIKGLNKDLLLLAGTDFISKFSSKIFRKSNSLYNAYNN